MNFLSFIPRLKSIPLKALFLFYETVSLPDADGGQDARRQLVHVRPGGEGAVRRRRPGGRPLGLQPAEGGFEAQRCPHQCERELLLITSIRFTNQKMYRVTPLN